MGLRKAWLPWRGPGLGGVPDTEPRWGGCLACGHVVPCQAWVRGDAGGRGKDEVGCGMNSVMPGFGLWYL